MSASAHPTEQVGQSRLRGNAPEGRGELHDQPRRRRGRQTTQRGTLVGALVAIAALTLTACEDGEGLRDEGPSTPTSPTATAPATPPSSDHP